MRLFLFSNAIWLSVQFLIRLMVIFVFLSVAILHLILRVIFIVVLFFTVFFDFWNISRFCEKNRNENLLNWTWTTKKIYYALCRNKILIWNLLYAHTAKFSRIIFISKFDKRMISPSHMLILNKWEIESENISVVSVRLNVKQDTRPENILLNKKRRR